MSARARGASAVDTGSRNAVTGDYLQDVAARGEDPGALRAAALAAADLGPTSYGGRCLTRPAFLDRAERDLLEADLRQLHTALNGLPDRLFGGDLGGLARAAGMTEAQVTAIQRGRGTAPTRLTRADLYHDGATFRLMELNIGSTVGGLDNAVLNRAVLSHPPFAEFAAGHKLGYPDTMAELARMLTAEYATDSGRPPLFAAADWPASFATLEPQLRASAAVLGELGVEIIPCHLGQLDIGGGEVRLGGRHVDVVYRVFMNEDLLDPGAPELVDPVLRAVERGEVQMFAPMDAELYGSKAVLAMLSDEANRDHFDAAELESLDRLLPWTRMVRDAPVTVDGERVGLPELAAERREELVLKPTLMHGGLGVMLGWRVDPQEWMAAMRAATDGPYVLQRRIRSVPEPFPAAVPGGTEQQLVNWMIFSMSRGFGGGIVRGSTDLSGGVLNSAGGATLGCCFTE
ncbi:MAG: hypothetical protein ACJ73E_19020 [Mycobacteriales bacterium]